MGRGKQNCHNVWGIEWFPNVRYDRAFSLVRLNVEEHDEGDDFWEV